MMDGRAGGKHLSLTPMELVVLVLWRQLDKAVLGFPGGREQEEVRACLAAPSQQLLTQMLCSESTFEFCLYSKEKPQHEPRFKSHSAHWSLNVCVDTWQAPGVRCWCFC